MIRYDLHSLLSYQLQAPGANVLKIITQKMNRIIGAGQDNRMKGMKKIIENIRIEQMGLNIYSLSNFQIVACYSISDTDNFRSMIRSSNTSE